jgi:hypothetical protein
MRRSFAALAFATVWSSLPAATPLQAQNLLANPTFDTGLAGWDVASVLPSSFVGWQPVDADGSPASGSARAALRPGSPGALPAFSQCVAVAANMTYALAAKVRANAGDWAPVAFDVYSNPNCTGTRIASGEFPLTGTPAAWKGVGGLVVTPAAAVSVRVKLSAQTSSGFNDESWDDIYFGAPAPAICVADATSLCLNGSASDHRFAIQGTFSSPPRGVGGEAHAISLDSLGVGKGGIMWFFAADNPELLVKVLDGCTLTGYYWVYVSAGTDVGVDLRIGDTSTGVWYLFHSPDGMAFPNIQNVYALPCS